jgi:hypothetical protein
MVEMVIFEDRLHNIVRSLLQKGQFDDELRERLKEYVEGDLHKELRRVHPSEPGSTSRYGRAKTGEMLSLCAEGWYDQAWVEFQKLEEHLRGKGWMGLLEGDLYRLGALIARRCGNEQEAARLDQEYREYRERYIDSFEALVVRSLVGLWEQPESLAEFEEALFGEPIGAEEVPAPSWVQRWLGELAERVRWAVAPIGSLAPAPAVAAAGTPEGKRELEGEAEEGRLRWRVLREEDESVWVWVETEEAGLEKVLVVLGSEGEGEPAVRAEVKVGPLGGGRYGGLAFIGRWEDLGLGERPVAVFAAVREGESR